MSAFSADQAWEDFQRAQVRNYMNSANALPQRLWMPYSGKRVADLSADQYAAMNNLRAIAGAGGDPYTQAAGNQSLATLNGDYLGHAAGVNPYMGNAPLRGNAYQGAMTGQNPMMGMNNPYLDNAIQQAQGDVTRQYNQTTAPQTDAAFARAGAFGGSAWGNQTSQNNYQLGQDLGRVASGMRMQDYGQQQQLQENALNRQQADIGRNAQLDQNAIQNLLAAWGQNMGTAQTGINLNEAAYQNERNRQMSGINDALATHQQGINDANSLMQSGNVEHNYQQSILDDAKWYDQARKQGVINHNQYLQNAVAGLMRPSGVSPGVTGQSSNGWGAGASAAMMALALL